MATRRGRTSQLPHLLVTQTAKTKEYHPDGGGPQFHLPARNRRGHAATLLKELREIKQSGQTLELQRKAASDEFDPGLVLQFSSKRDFEIKFESLDLRSQGIELLSVKSRDGVHTATCFVPDGKLGFFIGRIESYKSENTVAGNPKHNALVASIESIQLAAVSELWSDDESALPRLDVEFNWEVWLRNSEGAQDQLRLAAQKVGAMVLPERIRFPERTVVAVTCTRRAMGKIVRFVNAVAELRAAPKVRADFVNLSPEEEFEITEGFLEGLSVAEDANTVICILDTGVNNSHPLLQSALENSNCHTYKEAWGTDDQDSHGTEMAGIALYGNLASVLESGDIELKHSLESVKILNPLDPTPPRLYGAVTHSAVQLAEAELPDAKRVVAMAITADESVDGEPTTWSAAVDALIAGYPDEQRRLMLVSAGNCVQDMTDHPACCLTSAVQDPGQAWNALTVGAYTKLDTLDPHKYPDYTVVAAAGDISPYSSSSAEWGYRWPIKPDVVFEGGNSAIDPLMEAATPVDELSLLTTHFRPTERMFSFIWATSASTALGANFAASLQAAYPQYWPETIRGLVVHSADWTNEMRSHFLPLNSREQYQRLLRCCGYGVPDFGEACWSAKNSLTLVAQDEFQPYEKVDGSYKTTAINIHTLPWPKEALEDLGSAEVELRVTLSYYIEPSPGRRGWRGRYRYSSHALRFDVKTAIESPNAFLHRVHSQDEDGETLVGSSSDSAEWLLGPQLRHRGSIHSDRWVGSASRLARRSMIAVYPVVGWWRERPHLGSWNKRARYSLIVSIKTKETEVDIYTPVENLISTEIDIEDDS